MKRWQIVLIGSVGSVAVLGLILVLHATGWYGRRVSDLLEVPYRATAGSLIDGVISPGEYPDAIDLGEGWRLHWVHDGTQLYLGMETPGHGWVGAGFMPSSPDPSNLGAYLFSVGFDDDGDVISVSGFDSGGAMLVQPGSGPQAFGRASEEEGTVVELSLPLQLPPGRWLVQSLEPGSTYRFLLAYHRTSSVFMAYHGKNRRALDVRLAPIQYQTKGGDSDAKDPPAQIPARTPCPHPDPVRVRAVRQQEVSERASRTGTCPAAPCGSGATRTHASARTRSPAGSVDPEHLEYRLLASHGAASRGSCDPRPYCGRKGQSGARWRDRI